MTAPAPTPRRLPLRFSLRVLLLAVTAFAIGFPIWYRWPYEEAEPWQGFSSVGPNSMYRVKTWQRQWGGGRLQHGEERIYIGDKLVEVYTYRAGKRQGSFRRFNQPENYVSEEGHYEQGLKQGAWRWLDPKGQELARTEYLTGKIVRAVYRDREGREQVIEFRNDAREPRIVAGGRTLEDRLARLAREGRIDDVQLCESLRLPISVVFGEARLKSPIMTLAECAEISLILDPHHVNAERQADEKFHEIPFSAAMTVLTGTQDLACDYRYGHVWVTSAEDVKGWRDPTGVADLVPAVDSHLMSAWNAPIQVNAKEQPLADTLKFLAHQLAIELDVSQIEPGCDGKPSYPVTFSRYDIKLRHALGILLYQTRCRCKLEGETLVILPPEPTP